MEDRSQVASKTSRRSFLKFSLGVVLFAGLIGAVRTIIEYLWPTKEIIGGGTTGGTTAIPINELPVGSSKTVRHQGKPYVVVHLSTGVYAVNAVCTHLGCIVSWDKDKKVLACPCHTAFFALNGSVISGPPPAPLPVIQAKVVGEQIVLS